jgi:hypothetical protein
VSAPVQTRTGRGRRTVARSRVLAAVVSVLLVTVAMVAYRLSEPRTRYDLSTAQLDQPVSFGSGRVMVSEVRTGQALHKGDEVTSSVGLFVVVRVTVQATGRDKITVADSQLQAGGRTYTPVETTTFLVSADPGFQSSDDVAFEVDPGSLAGATLTVWDGGFVTRYEQRVQAPLGITSANAERWATAGRESEVTLASQPETRALP